MSTENQLTLVTVIIGASATLITAIIGAVVAIRNNNKSRKNEHRLSILKILLEAAYKEYEFRTKEDLAKQSGDDSIKIKSFAEYIIFYRELADLFSKEEVSENELINSLQKNKKLIDSYYKYRELERPEYHKS